MIHGPCFEALCVYRKNSRPCVCLQVEVTVVAMITTVAAVAVMVEVMVEVFRRRAGTTPAATEEVTILMVVEATEVGFMAAASTVVATEAEATEGGDNG